MRKVLFLILFAFIAAGLTACAGDSPVPETSSQITTEEVTQPVKPDLYTELQDGAIYRIRSESSGMFLTVDEFGIYDKSVVVLEHNLGDMSQFFRAVAAPDGGYRFVCMTNLTYLEPRITVHDAGVRVACVSHESPEDAVVWYLEKDGGDIFASIDDGFFLGLRNGSVDEGANFELCTRDNAEKISFKKMSDGNGDYPYLLLLSGDVESATSCPEIIRYKDIYYNVNMTGAVTVKISSDLKQWTKIGTAYASRPSWCGTHASGVSIWAPGVYKIKDKYYLYIANSSSGSQMSQIGVGVATTLDPFEKGYGWRDLGVVLTSKTGDPYNAIDPDVFVEDDGTAYFIWGSSWQGIFMRKLDPDTGKLDETDTTLYHLAQCSEKIEAPYLIKRDGYYYLFLARGKLASNYHWAVGRSESLFGPYVDRNGRKLLDGFTTQLTEWKNGIQGAAHAHVFTDNDGTAYMVSESWLDRSAETPQIRLHISKLVWSDDGWPVTVLSPAIFNDLNEK